MFKLNIKIAIRNLLKNSTYSIVNMLGLAIGLSGVIFVLLYVNHERSYEHWDDRLGRVYQLQELDFWAIKEGKKEWMEEADSRLATLLKEGMPQVEAVSVVAKLDARSVILDNQQPFLQENIFNADSSFFDVFPFQFVYGDPGSALSKPGSVVIKEHTAQKYFGSMNPVGKMVQINQQNWTKPEIFTITGVVREPKTPTSVDFELVQRSWRERPPNDHFYSMVPVYVKMRGDYALSQLDQSGQALYQPFKKNLLERQRMEYSAYTKQGLSPQVRFIPFQELHQQPLKGKSWLDLIKPVILLSILMLLVSIINFVNMFTAQAISRAKEVGVKKVIGAQRRALIMQFLWETALQCFLALLVSVILIEAFLPYLNQIFALSLSFLSSAGSLTIMIQLVVLLAGITLLSGLYPAFFLSAYQPQLVLKGSFSQGVAGKNIRSVLVGLQLVIAVGFFVGVLILSRQIDYMTAKDPGFNSESVIVINENYNRGFAARISGIEGVQYLGSNNGMISRNSRLTGFYKWNNEAKEWNTVLIHGDGLQAIGAKLLKGRLFDSTLAQDSIGTVILNESLERHYGGNMVGKYMEIADSTSQRVQVIGVISDMQVSGFENRIEPTVYTAARTNATGYPNNGLNYVIRFDKAKHKEVMAALEEVWKEKYPAFPFTFTYLKDDLHNVLIPHERFKRLVNLFSVLSISLSLIGLFALAAFLTRQRIKEIAIRKILGADNKSLFVLLNKGYFWLVIGANMVSWPLIYILTEEWLKGFAYRIELSWIPFLIALIVSVFVTVVTVSLQVKNAVKASPVDALKYE